MVNIFTADFSSLKGWRASASDWVTLETVDGVRCVRLTADGSLPDGADAVQLTQRLDRRRFTERGEYRLRFRARSDRFPQEYNVYLALRQGDRVSAAIGWEWRQVGPSWQIVEYDFRDVNPLATEIDLVLQVKAPGQVWIADLSVHELPAGTIGAEERSLKDVPRYSGSRRQVSILSDRRFVVEGKPFFPIGLWGIDFPDEQAMDDMVECGFNVSGTGHLVQRGPDGVRSFLDQLRARGLYAAGVLRFDCMGETAAALADAEQRIRQYDPIVSVTRLHPAFFMYDIADEPAWIGVRLSAFAQGAHWLRRQDPNHPLFSNQAPRGSVSLLRRWYRFVDVGGSDIYPWWNGEPDRHSDLPNRTLGVVGDETVKNLRAIGARKPVIMTLQAFGWSDGTTDPGLASRAYGYPPVAVQRFMVYDAIVHGATGVMLFQDQRYRGVNKAVKPVSTELRLLHDVLAAPSEAGFARCVDRRAASITRRQGSRRTVFVVNRSAEPLRTHLVVRNPDAHWTAYDGSRVERVADGLLIQLDAWGVGIYQTV